MAVTPASFRVTFPEFSDVAKFTDPEVQFWLDLGVNLLNAARWGNLFDYGLQLFAAHNLAVQTLAKKGQVGVVQGPLTGGSVDKVSYQRNPALVMNPKNGHWNLTTYGLRYVDLVNMVGAGPVQLGAPAGGEGDAAWPGPWQSIMPNPSN